MISIIKTALFTTWDLWCIPFSFLPYGDPYVATLAVLVIGGFATTKIINN